MFTAEEMESAMVYVGSGNWQNGIQVICQKLQILGVISKDLYDSSLFVSIPSQHVLEE